VGRSEVRESLLTPWAAVRMTQRNACDRGVFGPSSFFPSTIHRKFPDVSSENLASPS